MIRFNRVPGAGTLVLSLFAILAGAIGCGASAEDARYAVTGTVTLDGDPVSDGRIKFLNLAEGGSSASAEIVNGQYTVPIEFGVKPGEQVVQIEAYRKSNARVPQSGYLSAEQLAEGATEQYLPPRYNTQSELTIQVTADGDGKHDFQLKSGG